MKNLIAAIATVAAVLSATQITMACGGGSNGGGRLNASVPSVRNVNVPMKLEAGYLSKKEINSASRGRTNSGNSHSR